MMSWTAEMVEGLLEARAAGQTEFARAWRHAERRASRPRPGGLRAPADEGADWLPLWGFFRRACQAEWEGRAVVDYAGLPRLLERHDEPGPLGTEHVRLLA